MEDHLTLLRLVVLCGRGDLLASLTSLSCCYVENCNGLVENSQLKKYTPVDVKLC